MILEIIQNLKRGEKLLMSIDNQEYTNKNTPPYFSSIGSHLRHILDIYQCVFTGLEGKIIDFTERSRNLKQEQSAQAGLDYLHQIIAQLQSLNAERLTDTVLVTDDLGNGKVKAEYSLAAVFIQVHSHTIHHFAIIGFLIYNLGIQLPDVDFGYNPTTPRKEVLG